MKTNSIHLLDYEHELNSVFRHYPLELIEASLATLEIDKKTFVLEELNISQLCMQELKNSIQHCLNNFQLHHNYPEPIIAEEINLKNLKSLVKLLTGFIPIGYIFCNHHKQNNYWLTIVLDQYLYKPLEEVQNLVNFALKNHSNFSCAIFTYGTMVDCINNAHFYYSNLCIEKYCIYQSQPNFILGSPNPTLLAAAKLKAKANFKLYYRKSNIFLNSAKDFFTQNEYAMSAFMLQQACEFSFNGIITTFKGKTIKSHDLLILRKHASHYLPSLIGLFHDHPKKEIKILSQIQEAYINARYDEYYEISSEDLIILLTASQKFIKNVKVIFEEQFDYSNVF